MRNIDKQRRKQIVQRLREEGRQAALDGKSVQSNPHKYMDAQQWYRGYAEGEREKEAQDEQSDIQ